MKLNTQLVDKSNRILHYFKDFNVDVMSAMSVGQRFKDCMQSLFLLPLISIPTRVTNDSQTLIDNNLTNQLSAVKSGVLNVQITDHFPIYVAVPINNPNSRIHKQFRDHSVASLRNLSIGVNEFLNDFCVG